MTWDGAQIRASGGLGLDGDHRPQGTIALDVDGAMKAPAAGTMDDRLARAIVGLAKVANDAPHGLLLNIASGAVNLRVTKEQQIILSAGSLGPLY
jgi:hypothetical protein